MISFYYCSFLRWSQGWTLLVPNSCSRLGSGRHIGGLWCHLQQSATCHCHTEEDYSEGDNTSWETSRIPKLLSPLGKYAKQSNKPHCYQDHNPLLLTQDLKKAGLLKRNRYMGQTGQVFQKKIITLYSITYWLEQILQESKYDQNRRNAIFLTVLGV